jgi:hypothetical protein
MRDLGLGRTAERPALQTSLRAAARRELGQALSGGRRRCLRSAPRRFSSSRRSREAAVGRVARRCLRGASACASRSPRRARASSRLRDCERSSWATATTRGPIRASARPRSASLNEGERSTSKTASTREAVTFACCPPGPEERLVRRVISASGIDRSSLMRRCADELSAAPTGPPSLPLLRARTGSVSSSRARRRRGCHCSFAMQHNCADPLASSLPSVSHTLPLTPMRPSAATVHSWSISSHSQPGAGR